MDSPQTAWGIDIGQCAVKALKLRHGDGGVEVEACHIIEHSARGLGAERDRTGCLPEALRRLPDVVGLSGCQVVASVPSPHSVSRFIHLPPVDRGAVGDLVRFEARQQIPYPLREAAWRWQIFGDDDAPDRGEVDVALFALRASEVQETLDLLSGANVGVGAIQMRPVALYNLMIADGQAPDDGATLLADLGAESIEFVIAEAGRLWTHTAEFGASRITDALATALDIPFAEAEALQRAAADRPDGEEVLQGAEMAVNELVLEFRRCVDNYQAIGGVSKVRRVVGVGRGLRVPGLREAIECCLEIHVARLKEYNRIRVPPTPEAAAFRDDPGAFAVACGLALQGLGQAAVNVDFMPSGTVAAGHGPGESAGSSWRGMANRLLRRLRGARP